MMSDSELLVTSWVVGLLVGAVIASAQTVLSAIRG